jgi:thymidylate synthase
MPHPEFGYLTDLKNILQDGEYVPNRTGVSTYRLLGLTQRYNFDSGFPLLTTKKVWFKGIVHELLWFLKGDTNIKYLVDNDINIWNDDAYRHYLLHMKLNSQRSLDKENFLEVIKEPSGSDAFLPGYRLGDLGPVYGKQWRNFNGVDQIKELINSLKNNPISRRHILSAWNPEDINDMALPPCHVLSQFTVTNGNKLWCQLYQRSCDMFLGVPFNIASYSLLTYMLAQVTGLKPGGLIWTGHDCHIYENHRDAVLEQVKRLPYDFPQLELNPSVLSIDDFKYEDIKVINYKSHDTIKANLVT